MSKAIERFPRAKPVDYKKFRPEIRSGDLLLCSGSGLFSRMIQAATGSVWSHVGFVMRLDYIDRVMVLESLEPLGVRTVPLSKYLDDYDSEGSPYPGGLVIARHTAFETIARQGDGAALRKLGQFAVDLFGYPYDSSEIARIAARIAASHLPFTTRDKRALKRDREFICSEYVWECYSALGIQVHHDDKGFVAPADFAGDQNVELQAVLKKRG